MQYQIGVAPSILSGDFGALAEEAQRLELAGADAIHIDVMDGHFVRNLTFGPQAVAAIRRSTKLFLDVHLMIYHPFNYIEAFVAAGANRLTIHLEATEDVEETLQFIRRCNIEAGLAICPETSASLLVKYLDQCDLMLLMTVHPGFGGQKFIPEVLEKVSFIRQTCERLNLCKGGKVRSEKDRVSPPFTIEVDGGIDDTTGPLAVRAGANLLVSGTHLFRSPDMKSAIAKMKGLS